jgi:hypothetical protein
MTIRMGAPLSIEIKIETECRIIVKNESETVEAVSRLSQTKLNSVNKKLREDLDKFRTALATVQQWSVEHVAEQLLLLQRRGRLILGELFQGDPDKLVKTVGMCNSACPNWGQPGSEPDSLTPGLIIVRTPLDSGIPVEMLPLFELETPDEFKKDLNRIAASFLSFSAIVKRNIGVAPPLTDRLVAKPRLPIKLFIYHGLPGVEQTRDFLRNNNMIDLDGGWPDATSKPEEFAEKLAHHLWESKENFAGSSSDPPCQICFFACHCDTTADNPADYTVTLHTGRGLLNQGERKIDLETLTDKLDKLRRNNVAAHDTRPLVFFNACGGAAVDPVGSGSFPDLFLNRDLGFLGFIGTQATIPDAFAAVFSQTFCEYLFKGIKSGALEGMDIGQALYASRWKLLKDKKNPLGILYSLYAEPEIRVRKI